MTAIKRYIDGQWTTVVVGRQGDPGIIWQGEWDNSTEYNPPDAVFYEGSTWICTATSEGDAPSLESSFWDLFAGGSGGIGPVEVYEVAGDWDSVEEVSVFTLDNEEVLNKTLIRVLGDTGHTNDDVAVKIEYGIGSLGDRVEFYCGDAISFVNQKMFFEDDNNVGFLYNTTENLPSVSRAKIISATKVYDNFELVSETFYDIWLLEGDLDDA
jgi:hypothetical protein